MTRVMKKNYIMPITDIVPMITLPYMVPESREPRRGYAIDNDEALDENIIDIEEQTDDGFIDIF